MLHAWFGLVVVVVLSAKLKEFVACPVAVVHIICGAQENWYSPCKSQAEATSDFGKHLLLIVFHVK